MSGHQAISSKFQKVSQVKKLISEGMDRWDAALTVAPSSITCDQNEWVTNFLYDNSEALKTPRENEENPLE